MDQTIWECLNKEENQGMLFTSCGAELQELMRQIDIMVRNKKLEWETELVSTQDCLSLREQELAHARVILDQKHQEINVLKHQVDNYESGQNNVASQYEGQLNNLKTQLKNLKDVHNKMQRSRSKKNQNSNEREKELMSELEHIRTELKDKRNLCIQHDKEASEWDVRRRALQHQTECLESQKRSLAANYERVQQQLSLSQSRLKRSNRLVEEVEGTSQSLLKKLEEELSNDKELIQRQEVLISELQAKTKELNVARHSATGEKYRFQEQSDKANCRLKVLEEECIKLQASLSARESALRGSEHEIGELRSKNNELNVNLQTKSKIIEAMQVRSPLKSKEDDLQHKITILEASVDTMTSTEAQLRVEVKSLEEQLKMSKEEAGKLDEILQKNAHIKVNTLNAEIRTLQSKLEEMEASHSAQLCGMKAEVSNLTSHLHGRDSNITRLSQTCAEMERQLKEESQRRDKLDAELKTASQHLSALMEMREEVPVGKKPSDTDRSLHEAASQLTDLRQNYGRAVSKLGTENQQLKQQVNTLKSRMVTKEQEEHERGVTNHIAEMNFRREKEEMKEEYERKISDLESKLQDIQEPVILPSSSSSVIVRSDHETDTLATLTPRSGVNDDSNKGGYNGARTPTPTKDFLKAIGIESASSSIHSSYAASMSEKQLHALLGITDEGFEDKDAEDFAAEEEQRVVELESRIEKHIGDMQKAMEAAMMKYSK